MTKRYLLFSGDVYYPDGGWHDYQDSFDSVDDAKSHADKSEIKIYEWAHVVDSETMKIVAWRNREDAWEES